MRDGKKAMKKKAFIYIVVAGLLWGTSGVFVHFLAPYGFSSLQMTAVRGTVSSVAIAIFALLKDRKLFKIKPLDLLICLGVGTMLYLASACYYSAIPMTSVSTAVMLMYTAPVFVAAASVVMFGEKMSKMKIVAIVIMLVGCCLVSGVIGNFKVESIWGILLALFAGLTYGSYNLFSKLAMRRGMNPLTVTVYGFMIMMLIGFCVTSPVGIVTTAAKAPMQTVPLLLGLGLCTFVVPYTLYTIGLRDLPAGTASALSIVEPMSATVYSIAFLGETLTAYSVMGIILVVGSVLMLSREEE